MNEHLRRGGARAAGGRRYGTPQASYRVQLHAGFTLHDARDLVPYLDDLGISHLYCSPLFRAAPGSAHGYDVFDHNQINPELGGLTALYDLSATLTERDMGLIVDIVPNHVGLAEGANPWWRDVLRFGQASRFAPYFDINWETLPHLVSGVLVFPILGKPFGAALEAGELRLDVVDGDLALRYYDFELPLAPHTYATVLGLPPPALQARLRDASAFADLVGTLEGLQAAAPGAAERLLDRFRQLIQEEPAIEEYARSSVAGFNGRPGDPSSFDALERLLSAQHYRIAYWRVSGEEINYRRFFDINELAGIRVEREEVFEETHRLLLDLAARGIVTGVRVDHVDGLYDPTSYLRRLRERLREVTRDLTPRELPIFVEKILSTNEALPAAWEIAGTTGYDALALVDNALVDRAGTRDLTLTYEQFTGRRLPARFHDIVYRAKWEITRTAFTGEITVLAMELHRLARRHRLHRDETLNAFRRALQTVLACFPIYRTYAIDGRPGEADAEIIGRAIDDARRREAELSSGALAFLSEVLCLGNTGVSDDEAAQRLRFRQRFEQLSGPVMAKGFEDTALYRYNRLVSLNEVGNDPSRFGAPLPDIHAWFTERARRWPAAMSASSTHDTKRGEDTRARLHVLSELAGVWRAEVRAWSRLNGRYRTTMHGETAPDANTEYLIYQTLAGAWPLGMVVPDDAFGERLAGYLLKAIREMKVQTSWTTPNERYEQACQEFLAAILDPERSATFLERIASFVRRIAPAGVCNSLTALTVKSLAPGFPDFYQGTEFWWLVLTDPDNRAPVDFDLRRRVLASITDAPPTSIVAPEFKLWLTRALLRVRAVYPDLMAQGAYRPLVLRGRRAGNLFAFAREHEGQVLTVVVPRLVTRLLDEADARIPATAWAGTTVLLPRAGVWHDELTNQDRHLPGRVEVADLFGAAPVAVLSSQPSPQIAPTRRAARRKRGSQ